MKSTVVPAQVTTVEDRVAGNLGFTQLILLAIPIFGGSLLFAVLPPGMGMAGYKAFLIGALILACSLMALRINGKIVLLWLVVLLRYFARPKYYVFSKRSSSFRENDTAISAREPALLDTKLALEKGSPLPRLGLLEASHVYAIFDDPTINVQFETTRKGGLHVRLTENEE